MLSTLRAGQRPSEIAKFLSMPKSPMYDIRNHFLASEGAKRSKGNPIGSDRQISHARKGKNGPNVKIPSGCDCSG